MELVRKIEFRSKVSLDPELALVETVRFLKWRIAPAETAGE